MSNVKKFHASMNQIRDLREELMEIFYKTRDYLPEVAASIKPIADGLKIAEQSAREGYSSLLDSGLKGAQVGAANALAFALAHAGAFPGQENAEEENDDVPTHITDPDDSVGCKYCSAPMTDAEYDDNGGYCADCQ